MFCNSSCVPENANAAAAPEDMTVGVKASDGINSVPGTPRQRAKGGKQQIHQHQRWLLPHRNAPGTLALPHGFAEVRPSSSSCLSQKTVPSLLPRFTAQSMDFAKPNDLADLAFGDLNRP